MKLTGAQALIKSLEMEGVEVMFGLPGGAIPDPTDIPRVIREAFHVATTGRPGPVLVDFPKDVANQTMEWYWPEKIDLPGYKPTVKGHPKQIKDAARLIQEASKPVILAGGGILKANATAELRELAELANIPVTT